MVLRQDGKSRASWNPEDVDERHPITRLRTDAQTPAPVKKSPFLRWSDLFGER
jgi:hypothetical protein